MGSAINRNARLMGIVGKVCREAARLKNHLGSGLALEQHEVALFVEFAGIALGNHLGIDALDARSHNLHVDVALVRFELAIFECLRIVFSDVHIQRIAIDIVAAARQCRQVVLARPFNCTAHAFMADSRQIGAFDISENHGMSFLVANPKTAHHRAAHPL